MFKAISYSVKLDGINQGRIMSYRPNISNGDFGFDLGYWNGNLYYNVSKSNPPPNAPSSIIFYNNVPLNTFINVACVYDNGLMKLYIDSSLVATSSYDGPFANSSSITNLTFGYTNQEPNERFSGLLDNVNIWDIALTEQEIQQYMNCPLAGDEEGWYAHDQERGEREPRWVRAN